MDDRVALTQDEERILLRWLIREIVDLVKLQEKDGERDLRYLTSLKLTKMLFLVAEECNLDITRAWYRYGGWVCPPQGLVPQQTAKAFYYNKAPLKPADENLVRTKFKAQLVEIKDKLEQRFNEIFYKKTEEFLDYFYEDNAPPAHKGKYIAYRKLMRYFDQFTSPQVGLTDLLLPGSDPDPWNKPYIFSQMISRFHQELPDILPEHNVLEVVEFTRLMEHVALTITWKKKHHLPIRSSDYTLVQKLKENFNEKGWGLIATYIAVNTVQGTRQEEARMEFETRKTPREAEVPLTIKTQTAALKQAKLLPTLSILKEFYNAKYRDMYEEASREGLQWVTN